MLKKSYTATTIVFEDTDYVDKLSARKIDLDESDNSAPILRVDFSHYSKRKRKNLEDSDFDTLKREKDSIKKLTLRDATVAKKIREYDVVVAQVEIKIDDSSASQYPVTKQTVDHRELTLEL